jgi:hypothetical protein
VSPASFFSTSSSDKIWMVLPSPGLFAPRRHRRSPPSTGPRRRIAGDLRRCHAPRIVAVIAHARADEKFGLVEGTERRREFRAADRGLCIAGVRRLARSNLPTPRSSRRARLVLNQSSSALCAACVTGTSRKPIHTRMQRTVLALRSNDARVSRVVEFEPLGDPRDLRDVGRRNIPRCHSHHPPTYTCIPPDIILAVPILGK